MNLTDIVTGQAQAVCQDGLELLILELAATVPDFVVHLISGWLETNRHPFDTVEGEAEIVAGHMVEIFECILCHVFIWPICQYVADIDSFRHYVSWWLDIAI